MNKIGHFLEWKVVLLIITPGLAEETGKYVTLRGKHVAKILSQVCEILLRLKVPKGVGEQIFWIRTLGSIQGTPLLP